MKDGKSNQSNTNVMNRSSTLIGIASDRKYVPKFRSSFVNATNINTEDNRSIRGATLNSTDFGKRKHVPQSSTTSASSRSSSFTIPHVNKMMKPLPLTDYEDNTATHNTTSDERFRRRLTMPSVDTNSKNIISIDDDIPEANLNAHPTTASKVSRFSNTSSSDRLQ